MEVYLPQNGAVVPYYRYYQGRRWAFEYALWPRYWRLGFFIAWNAIGFQIPPVSVIFFFRKPVHDSMRRDILK